MKKNSLKELKKAELLLQSYLTEFFENFENTLSQNYSSRDITKKT
jgi:hypothetical protein